MSSVTIVVVSFLSGVIVVSLFSTIVLESSFNDDEVVFSEFSTMVELLFKSSTNTVSLELLFCALFN